MNGEIKVIGLTEEKFINTHCFGHNCEFEYEDFVDSRYDILVLYKGVHYYISLENRYGECGSGWCTASWGDFKVNKCDEHTRMPMTHIPKDKELYLKFYSVEFDGPAMTEEVHELDLCKLALSIRSYDFYPRPDAIKSNVFSYSDCGGDCYYPSGRVTVNMDLFEPLPRALSKMPIYILRGPSGIGKSWLAFNTHFSHIYETDTNEKLPDMFLCNMIVIGNKYKFDLEDILKRIDSETCETILLDFSAPLWNKEKHE